jgi:hypothetical protein
VKHLIEPNRQFLVAIVTDLRKILDENAKLLRAAPTSIDPDKILTPCNEIIAIAQSILDTIEKHAEL